MYQYFENLIDEVKDVPEGSILSKTVHDDDRVRVVMFSFAAGEELSEHTSTHAALLYFLRGAADVTLGDDRMNAAEGTFIHMTPELPHSIHANDPTVMLLIMLKPQA